MFASKFGLRQFTPLGTPPSPAGEQHHGGIRSAVGQLRGSREWTDLDLMVTRSNAPPFLKP